MKWKYETEEQRRKRLSKPHLWFAWYPVELDEDNTKVWLEKVTRKKNFIKGLYTYSWSNYSLPKK